MGRMNDQPLTLGQRIVLAAQLCVARHLAEAAKLSIQASSEDENVPQRGRRQQERIVIGGAGPAWVTDDPGKC